MTKAADRPSKRARQAARVGALLACGLLATPGHAALTYSLSFDDPLSLATPYYALIDTHIGSALNAWGTVLAGSAAIEVEVGITSAIPRATGNSVTSGFVGRSGGLDIFEQGMAYELRTGIDPNGSAPDVRFQLNPLYLAHELWFDPAPNLRTAAVDPTRTDAMSVFVHEFGHALAFNGWGDSSTGAVPSTFASPWDALVVFDGRDMFFTGPAAQAMYGGPVPVTMGNNFHIGNAAPPGVDLVPDLMNGVVFYRGTRYAISELDLAMVSDMGVSLVPEPATASLWLLGLAGLGLWARRLGRPVVA